MLQDGARPVEVAVHPQVEVGLGRAADHPGEVEDGVRLAKLADRRGQVPGHGVHPRIGGDVGRGAARSASTSSSTFAGAASPIVTGSASSRLASKVPMNPAPPVIMTLMLTAES
jgi:hypothetical protein